MAEENIKATQTHLPVMTRRKFLASLIAVGIPTFLTTTGCMPNNKSLSKVELNQLGIFSSSLEGIGENGSVPIFYYQGDPSNPENTVTVYGGYSAGQFAQNSIVEMIQDFPKLNIVLVTPSKEKILTDSLPGTEVNEFRVQMDAWLLNKGYDPQTITHAGISSAFYAMPRDGRKNVFIVAPAPIEHIANTTSDQLTKQAQEILNIPNAVIIFNSGDTTPGVKEMQARINIQSVTPNSYLARNPINTNFTQEGVRMNVHSERFALWIVQSALIPPLE